MSVRSCILAVLTLGQAYGLQLHSEIEARTARPGQINVGQIYSTLNRLVDAGLVVPADRDELNRLPRYALSAAGASEARRWNAEAEPSAADWGAMVEQVLLVASLPGIDPQPLLASYRQLWQRVGLVASGVSSADPPVSASVRAAAAADCLLASGALAWLEDVGSAIHSGALGAQNLSNERPRRGRRPSFSS